MKVLFLLNDGFGVGGTIRTTFNLAGALAARGHDVVVLSTHRRHDVPQLPVSPAVRLMSLLEARTGHPDYEADDPLRGRPAKVYPAADYRSGSYDRLAEDRYERYLAASDADVVIATRAGLIAYAARFAPDRMIRIGQEHLTRTQQRRAMRAELPRHIRRLDAFVTVSAHDAADYRAHLRWLRGTRVLFIPNSVPAPHVAPSGGETHLVVAAGRLVDNKRFDVLIRAFTTVVAAHPDWRLRIYGDGPEREPLRRLVLDLGLHNHVLLMGTYSPLEPEWAKGGVAAAASDVEPFGMTLVEAMRCGVPVVSTDAPHGPREILTDGVDGVLTPVGDVAALGEALRRLIGDPQRRRAMAAAALAGSARYDPGAIAVRYENLFEELAARKKQRRPPAYGVPPPVLGPAPTLTLPVAGCEVTPDGDVLLRPGPAIAADAALSWRRIGKGETAQLPQKGLTVRLGDLPDGAWQLELPGGVEVRAGLRETRALLDDAVPTDAVPTDGVHRQLPYRTVVGGLAVRVWRRPVHAEVGDVHADGAGVHVHGRLIGAELGPQAPTLELRGPDGAVREVPATARSATAFRALVPALGAGTWHLWLRYAPDRPPVRLGRFLDDVADKKHAYVLPAATVGGARLQPTYLWGNEFSVRATT
jgi:glycosyltransferase involved in cell wall biosynthesis